MARTHLTLLALIALTGCGPEAVLVSGVATLASYNMTGKSPMDNAMTYASGKDCNLLKVGENEGEYCVPHALKQDLLTPADPPRVYCFKTMGEVECHCSADPFNNRNEPFVRGRGVQANGATCGSARTLAALTSPEVTRPTATPLAPPPLPAEAYEDILEPAKRTIPSTSSSPGAATRPDPKGPLNLEYTGS